MTTGSLCLTEILKSRKPCSSNSEASHSADSTSASGVALPYLASSRLSSEPALTPIRIDTPASAGRPGDLADLVVERLDVARVDPHRRAAGVDRGEDVLRLEVDVGDHRDLRLAWRSSGSASASSCDGHRDPDDVAAGRGELGDLLQRRVDVGGQRRGHRLHRDRRVAADRDRADLDLPGLAARWRAPAGGRRASPARCAVIVMPPVSAIVRSAPGSARRPCAAADQGWLGDRRRVQAGRPASRPGCRGGGTAGQRRSGRRDVHPASPAPGHDRGTGAAGPAAVLDGDTSWWPAGQPGSAGIDRC